MCGQTPYDWKTRAEATVSRYERVGHGFAALLVDPGIPPGLLTIGEAGLSVLAYPVARNPRSSTRNAIDRAGPA